MVPVRYTSFMPFAVLLACQPTVLEQSTAKDSLKSDSIIRTAQTTPVSVSTAEIFVNDGGLAIRKVRENTLALAFNGDFLDAYSWQDRNGVNTVILSFRDTERKNAEAGEAEATAEIFVRQYVVKDAAPARILWELYDIEKDCIFDIKADFLGDTPYITDLDNDGMTETTVVYKLACRSDVSPAYMKVIMREGPKKYALRGSMLVSMQADEQVNIDSIEVWDQSKLQGQAGGWGLYESGADFAASPEFLEFAETLWKENVIETLN